MNEQNSAKKNHKSKKCVLEGCDFVGKTSYALETHIRSFHEEQLDYRNDSHIDWLFCMGVSH